MKKRELKKNGCRLALMALVLSGIAVGQDALKTLEPLTVVGSDEEIFKLPGSGSYVSAEEFRSRGYTNLKQIAAKVPSVFVRDEDGYGNFPNISLRGVDGTRSSKVTLMEDGILTAPSPYAAPAAYYSTKAGRMAGIEFLKGSSQVRYGPHTTGGVVNYLSTPIPQEGDVRFFSRTTYGSDNTFFNHTYFGDVEQTQAGRIGYLLEMHTQKTDGFRNIDGTNRDSGFDLYEPMLKLFWEPNTALEQRLEVKVGFTDFGANESYSGLTEADLRSNPNRRYAGSQFDRMDAEQLRTYVKWVGEPSDALRLESAAYFNSFDRNWNKLDGLRGDGLRTNVAQALLHAPSLAVLQGNGVGEIFTRDAFREHEAYGWQNQANFRFDTGPVSHDLALGLRLHYDRAGGTNQQIFYTSNSSGGFGLGNPDPVSSAGLSEVFSTALYVEDQIKIGALTLTPGIRYEFLDVENTTGAGVYSSSDENLVMGGLGANYELSQQNSIFGGIYRGASPANPAGYNGGTENEESLGFELGLRHRRDDAFRAELVGFYTDFSSLIAPEVGVGGGGLTPSSNGGAADVMGIESLVEYDYGKSAGWSLGLPVYASLTYTKAEFKGISGDRLGNGAGLFAGASNGNDIPYVPEWKLAFGIGLNDEKWGVNLDASYSTSTWGTGYNGNIRLDDNTNNPSNPTAVDGKVDSLLIFDLTGYYNVTDNVKLVGGIQNIFEEQGIVSRAPLGPRANAPRTIYLGAEIAF
jgi:Fe(3+) dicitrate transport protein